MLNPIPVSYVISAITSGEAGTEGHLIRLIKGLDRKRFSPRLIVLQRSPWTDQQSDSDFPVEVLDIPTFKGAGGFKAIRKLRSLFCERDDKIVELYFTDAHFAGGIGAKLAKVPVILSARRNLAYQYGKKELLMSKTANPVVTRFIANAREVVNVISKTEGIAESRFQVISNGVNLDDFDHQTQQMPPREYLAFCEGKSVIALAANLRPVKNVQGFLSAAFQVAEERPDVGFVIMGSGPDEQSLKSFANELGLGQRIFWAGSVPYTAPYLAQAQVGCLSSDSEGFSNAIVEYMAAGLPVVATRVGGAAECVIDSETGYLVGRGNMKSLASRIVEVLSDQENSRAMGARGRSRVEERFTFERQMTQYQELYDRLLSPAE